MRLYFGEPPLGPAVMAKDKALADDKSENRIAQKFETLIVQSRRIFRLLSECEGTVGQCADQQIPVMERVAEFGLQNLQVRCRHDYFAGGVVGAGVVGAG